MKRSLKETYYRELEDTINSLRGEGYEAGYALVAKCDTCEEKRPTISRWTHVKNIEPIKNAELSTAIRGSRNKYHVNANEYRMLGAYRRTSVRDKFIVIDFDVKNIRDTDTLVESTQWMEDRLGPASVVTPSGGLHWYIYITDDKQWDIPSRKFEFIDIKSGGGQVIIPPSKLVNFSDGTERCYRYNGKTVDGIVYHNIMTQKIADIINIEIPAAWGGRIDSGNTNNSCGITTDIAMSFLNDNVIPVGHRNNTIFAFLWQMNFNHATDDELQHGYDELLTACEKPHEDWSQTLRNILSSKTYKQKSELRPPEVERITSKGVIINGVFHFFDPEHGRDWIDIDAILMREQLDTAESQTGLDAALQRTNSKSEYKQKKLIELDDSIQSILNKWSIFYIPNERVCRCFDETLELDNSKTLFVSASGGINFCGMYQHIYATLAQDNIRTEGLLDDRIRSAIKNVFMRCINNESLHRTIYLNKYFDIKSGTLYVYCGCRKYLTITKNKIDIVKTCPQILSGDGLPLPSPINPKDVVKYINGFWNLDSTSIHSTDFVPYTKTIDILTFLASVWIPGMTKKILVITGTTGCGKTPLLAGLSALFTGKNQIKENVINPPSNANSFLRRLRENMHMYTAIDDFNSTGRGNSSRAAIEEMIINVTSSGIVGTETVKYQNDIDVAMQGSFMFTTSNSVPWKRADVNKRTEFIRLDKRDFKTRYLSDTLLLDNFLLRRQEIVSLILIIVQKFMKFYGENSDVSSDIITESEGYYDYAQLKRLVCDVCGVTYENIMEVKTSDRQLDSIDAIEGNPFAFSMVEYLRTHHTHTIKDISLQELENLLLKNMHKDIRSKLSQEDSKCFNYFFNDNIVIFDKLGIKIRKYQKYFGKNDRRRVWMVDGSQSSYITGSVVSDNLLTEEELNGVENDS